MGDILVSGLCGRLEQWKGGGVGRGEDEDEGMDWSKAGRHLVSHGQAHDQTVPIHIVRGRHGEALLVQRAHKRILFECRETAQVEPVRDRLARFEVVAVLLDRLETIPAGGRSGHCRGFTLV